MFAGGWTNYSVANDLIAASSTSASVDLDSYYVFHGRVTLFFDNNFLTQRWITMKFLPNFF